MTRARTSLFASSALRDCTMVPIMAWLKALRLAGRSSCRMATPLSWTVMRMSSVEAMATGGLDDGGSMERVEEVGVQRRLLDSVAVDD